jgi:uncharacterized protein YcbX
MNAVLHSIYRYPVKSMGGQTLTTTELTANGIPGDRSWAVKEGEGGAIRGGKRSPELMNCSTRVISEPSAQQSSPAVEIGLPDGTFIRTDDDQVNARLSALVESPVSLWPLMPADQLEFYQRQAGEPGANIDPETLLREVFARTADEPLPDLSQFPPELFQYESPPGTYFDAYPLLLLSRNALAQMQQAAPESNFDVRRFRPSLLIDVTAESGSPDDAFPEQAWAGKTLKLGGATLKIEMECPRCIMTIHGFADLPRDPSIMRSLVQENAGNLGVYATVLEPGAISVGDQLQVV